MSYWAKKRLLVTGGAGFNGRNLVEALRAAGCRNLTVARSADYDLTRENEVVRLLEDSRPEVVFHLARPVGGIRARQADPHRAGGGLPPPVRLRERGGGSGERLRPARQLRPLPGARHPGAGAEVCRGGRGRCRGARGLGHNEARWAVAARV